MTEAVNATLAGRGRGDFKVKKTLPCPAKLVPARRPLGYRFWGSGLMARSGLYTNRIGCSEIPEIFRSAGLEVEITDVDRWGSLPTPRRRMAWELRGRSEKELLVRGFRILARPAGVRVGGA